jgi:WD40 repeat protein
MMPDLVILDLEIPASRIVPIEADEIAVSDAHTTIARKRELSHLVGDRLVRLATAGDDVTALAYSPDGRVLAVGLANGTIEMFSGGDRVATLTGHDSSVRMLQWEGPEMLSLANDQTLRWSFAP